MADSVHGVLTLFIQRGLFDSPERAVLEMAQDYTLHQIERYRAAVNDFQAKYGMNYEQFDAYLKNRSKRLSTSSDPKLSQAVMQEEDDAFDWKVAQEMLSNWLGILAEVDA